MNEHQAHSAESQPLPWPREQRVGKIAILLAAAASFGGIDQYLGSLYSPFGTAVSAMSAPWLLLPFVVGAWQPRWRRAAWLGLAATWLAVGAYVLMIDSPMEGVHLTFRVVISTAYSQWPWFLAGMIAGPVYAVLGHLWRTRKSWLSAALATVPVLGEPVLGRLGLRPVFYPPAGYAEVVVGLALAGYFAVTVVRSHAAPAVDA